jgi:hypothetical protein
VIRLASQANAVIWLASQVSCTLLRGFESDDEPERRTWKATVRTQNNRGEVRGCAHTTSSNAVDPSKCS